MVTLQDGRLMILGGSSDSKEVIIYDSLSNQFVKQPPMTNGRMYAGCAVFNSPLYAYRPTIFIGSHTTAEVYDYTTPGAVWQSSMY